MGKDRSNDRLKGRAGRARQHCQAMRLAAVVSISVALMSNQAVSADDALTKPQADRTAKTSETGWDEARLAELMQVALVTKGTLDDRPQPERKVQVALSTVRNDLDFSELTHVLLATWYANNGSGGNKRGPSERHADLPPESWITNEPARQVAALTPGADESRTISDAPIVSLPLPDKPEPVAEPSIEVAALPPADHSIETKPKAQNPITIAVPAQRLNPTGRDIDLQVPFKDGGREIGSVLLRIGADDSLSLEAEGVLSLMEELFDSDIVEKLSAAAEDGRLTPKSFQIASLDLEYDPGLLELSLITTVESRKDQVVSLANETADPADVDEASALAGYVNIFTGIAHNASAESEEDEETGTFDQFLVDLDTAVYLYGPVLESEFTYEDAELNGDGEFFRTGTRLIVDDPERAVRYAGGDLTLRGEGFQDSLDALGIGIVRSFALQPGRNVRPTGRREFTIERPSSLDVIVNGAVVRRLRLLPGTYDLRDIPLSDGGNDIELLIEDDAGNVQRIDYSTFYDFELLAPGVIAFGFGGGIAADFGGEPDYDENEVLVSGFIRAGTLPSLTLGVNAQASSARRQVGVQAIMPLAIGNVAIDAAGSHIDGIGYGGAIGVDYQYIFANNDPSNRRLVLSAEAISANFGGADPEGDLDLDDDGDEALNDTALDLSANYSQSLIWNLRGSLGAAYGFGRGDQTDRYTITTSLSGPLGRRASWLLSSRYLRDTESDDDGVNILASINIPLGYNHDVSLSADSTANEVRGIYAYRGGSRVGSYGASIGLAHSDDEDLSVEASADYIGNRFRAAVDHGTRFTELDGDDRINATRLRAETALAFAGGKVAIGRPISDSFAIISTHPTLEDRDVYADPSKEGDLATSDWLGPALVPSINAYNTQRLVYDVEDLPTGYDLGAGAFTLQPTYRSGYALEVGSAATVTVMGTLKDEAGEPVSLLAGQAINKEDDDFAPVVMFTNRVGRFAISGLKPGPYKLKLNTKGEKEIEFEVPGEAVGLHRVGNLVVPG